MIHVVNFGNHKDGGMLVLRKKKKQSSLIARKAPQNVIALRFLFIFLNINRSCLLQIYSTSNFLYIAKCVIFVDRL